jgi:Tfp pilus assembly protein PilF
VNVLKKHKTHVTILRNFRKISVILSTMKKTYLLKKMPFLVLALLLTISQAYSQNVKELIKGAKAQIEIKQYKEAELLLNKCIENFPSTTDAFSLRAKCREKLFNFPGAAADWEKALQSDPGSKEFLSGAAHSHFEAANYKKASEYYNQLSGLVKNNAEIFALKARAELYQKNFKRAIDDASISITEKNNYLGYWVRAVAQDSMGKPELSAMDFTLSLEYLQKNKDFKESTNKSEFAYIPISAAICDLKRNKYDPA